MRPVRLTLRGFGAFSAEQELDFSDLDAFALVGATGSGKSTVLDALCFALYGRVPRYGRGAATSDVMSVDVAEMAVLLDFDAGGVHYRVARVVRRRTKTTRASKSGVAPAKTSAATTAEARLERIDGAAVTAMASGAREVDAEVEKVVGLGFEQFTRCVVLPQGDFARFLHDEPRERRALLLRLLDLGVYESIRSRAESMARENRMRADLLDEQRRDDGGDLEQLVERRTAFDRLDVLFDTMEPEFDKLEVDCREHTAEVDAIRRRLVALDAVTAPKQVPATDAPLRAAVASAETAERDAVTTWERLVAERQATASVDVLRELAVLHERVAKGREVISAAEPKLAMVHAAAAETLQRVAAAEVSLQSAVAEQLVVTRRHAAHALTASLVAGEPCPVCEQAVAKVPKSTKVPSIDQAEKAVRSAERALAAAQRESASAAETAAAADRRHQELVGRLSGYVEQLADQPDNDELAKRIAVAERRDLELDVARRALDAARGQLADSKIALDRFEAEVSAQRGAFHRTRDGVSDLQPPAPTEDLAADWAAFVSWAEQNRVEQRLAADDAAEALATAVTARDQLTAQLADVLAGLNVQGGRTFATMRAAAARGGAEARGQVEAFERERERVAKLAAESAAARRQSEIAGAVALHLRSDRFQDWLITEAIESLAIVASTTLLTLSGGAFSLVYRNDEFWVVDHQNGDEQRSARSLSGGETFQASLALAFALADEIARQRAASASLDAVFLDEGFGTLDPESLDRVAGALEELRDGKRLVGIVTHVPELAQRQPVRFRVTRSGNGSTITREVG
jgi:DNA repair protein SbcC/Rad50